MKIHICITFLLLSFPVTAQDSVSMEFTRMLNAYRKSLGLHELAYSLELEEFAHERLQVVSKATDHCFPIRNWNQKCPTIDLHFKFTTMAKKSNSDTSKRIAIVSENMSAYSQFIEDAIRKNTHQKRKQCVFAKIVSFFTSLFTPKDIVVSEVSYEGKQADEYEYKFLINRRLDINSIAYEMFNGWKNSVGHDINLRSKRITHFAFSYCFVLHNGREYLHGIWIGGEEKNALKVSQK